MVSQRSLSRKNQRDLGDGQSRRSVGSYKIWARPQAALAVAGAVCGARGRAPPPDRAQSECPSLVVGKDRAGSLPSLGCSFCAVLYRSL